MSRWPIVLIVVLSVGIAAAQGIPPEQGGPKQEPRKAREREAFPLMNIDPARMPPEEWPSRFPRREEPERPMPPRPERPRPDAEFILLHSRELGLSKDQLAELKSRRLETRLKAVELNALREQAHLKLEAALDEEAPDLQAIKKLVHDAANTEAELRYLDIELTVKARELLTDEQRSRLKNIPAAAPWRVVPPGLPPRVQGPPPSRPEPEPERAD